jgi:hypothetical protein
MKILGTFDRVVTEVLAEKVRARLTFKVMTSVQRVPYSKGPLRLSLLNKADMHYFFFNRATLTPTDSATKFGHS